MEPAKLRLKIGQLELEYEGSETFIENGLMHIIERLTTLDVPNMPPPPHEAGEQATLPPPAAQLAPPKSSLSTTDFAAQMGAKSGTDLVMAAASYLHHTKGVEEFRRPDILQEMKSAKAFFRASYGSNLTKSLDTLVKSGRLQNPRSDTYTLPYREIENTRPRL
jgi:hypothetical protein